MTLDKSRPLFEVNNLSLSFRHYLEGLHESTLTVIRNLDISIHHGEIVAIVGASGSGKSLLANAILGILPENAVLQGELNYQGKPLTRKRQLQLRGKEIALIPQSVASLDPLMKTGKQVQAVIKNKNRQRIQRDLFQKVDLTDEAANLYPFELSGGMARKVLAAMVMGTDAQLVIADEPTPGLDPSALAEIVKNIKQLASIGKGIMFITHDIEVALQIAHKVAVFYAGQTIEIANVKDFTGKGEALRHPYTKALWNALPQNEFTPLAGSQPLSDDVLEGCVFAKRCPVATNLCTEKAPESKEVRGGMVRCFYA